MMTHRKEFNSCSSAAFSVLLLHGKLDKSGAGYSGCCIRLGSQACQNPHLNISGSKWNMGFCK